LWLRSDVLVSPAGPEHLPLGVPGRPPARRRLLVAADRGTSTGAVTFNSLLQSHTPDALRGRIFAGFDMLWQLGRLVSLLVGGLLAAGIGIQAVYALGGALLLLAAAIGWAGARPAAARPGLSDPAEGEDHIAST
jgi:MFS family permease